MRSMSLSSKVSQPVLSDVEASILDVLWDKGEARVREIHDIVSKKHQVAHTSIAVLLDRMHTKQLVTRKVESCKGGFRYIYRPVESKDEFKRSAMQHAVDKLIDTFGASATSYFNERFGTSAKASKTRDSAAEGGR